MLTKNLYLLVIIAVGNRLHSSGKQIDRERKREDEGYQEQDLWLRYNSGTVPVVAVSRVG